MSLHPLTARAFITQSLLQRVDTWLAENGIDARVLDRIETARPGMKIKGFPYIVISGGEDVTLHDWAEEIRFTDDRYLVRWVMSSQAVPLGVDLEIYTAALDGAIQDALGEAHAPGPLGTIHGCKLVAPYRPPVYGDPEEELFCEIGWLMQVTSS